MTQFLLDQFLLRVMAQVLMAQFLLDQFLLRAPPSSQLVSASTRLDYRARYVLVVG